MDKLADLAKRMRNRREAGTHPYVLVLGAGASVSSGTSLNRAVVERIIGSYDPAAFDAYIAQCSDEERFSHLRKMVEGTSPSQGYRCLAELIRSGYFNIVLSTNFDPLLEDAVAGLQMRRRDYLLLIHGVMDPDFIANRLDDPEPRVKILKLHGDLFYSKFYYTGDEISEFPEPIRGMLEILLNYRDVVVVGHGMRDNDINRCLKATGGSVWYVNLNPPSGVIAEVMKARKSEGNFVSGDDGTFDRFFMRLRAELLGGTAEVSVDEIRQSIFRVATESGRVVGSGFLLGDTGLVITDSSILMGLGQGSALGVRARVQPFAGGAQRRAELVLAPEAVLDYAVFRAEGVVDTSPLELAWDLPSESESVTACISVGDSQGFRDGKVTRVNCNVPIGMGDGRFEMISNLIETDIHVEPGACGSPLVRKDGRVVGAIVAGDGRSYALTALRLRDMLTRAGLPVGS